MPSNLGSKQHFQFFKHGRKISMLQGSSQDSFCSLKQSETPLEKDNIRRTYWSASTVQKEIKSLLDSKAFKSSPHSAYLEIYARMTDARDKARCTKGNSMFPTTNLNRGLNDALSDIMTRNYLAIVKSSVENPDKLISPSLDLGGSFKKMHYMAEKNNWDSVRLALGSTSLYLTNHLALAVSALPHIDKLWEDTPYKDIPSRVNAMKEFKPTYDAFNQFLAKNLVTVTHGLYESKLTKNKNFENAAKLTQNLPWKLLFGVVRDNAFHLGLRIASHTDPGKHPWTSMENNGLIGMSNNVISMPSFPKNNELTRDLRDLKEFSSQALTYSTNNIWGVFGGKRFSDPVIAI